MFRDAVRLGLVVGTPAGRLCVFGAIEHAKAHGTKNVCGLFAWIVRNGRWNHINQQDEDRAHSTIRMLREGGVAHGKERAIRVQADNGSVLGGVPWRAPETARQILAGTGAEAYPILAAVSAALRQRRA